MNASQTVAENAEEIIVCHTTTRALLAAALVIEVQNRELVKLGKGRDLSSVPGHEGQEFMGTLRAIAHENETERDARTKLHAAAPDLLEAMRTIAILASSQQAIGGDLLDFQDRLRECGDKARAAIARAEGGAK